MVPHLKSLIPRSNAYFVARKASMLAALLLFFVHGALFAAEQESAFSLSGFGNIAVGKILRGTSDPATNLGYGCPCFIADYAQNAVYEGKVVRFKPDSKLGLQGQWSSPEKQYSITAQIISRGAANGNVNVEWLYGTAEINSNLTLQVGRKRLPLLQFSEVQDVSHALPWIHLPPQVYGWEIVNYNGANLRYRDEWKSFFVNANMFIGNESNKDAGFWKVYNGKYSKTSSKWSNIVGTEVKVSKGWFDARAFYMQSNTQNLDHSTSIVYSAATKQRISGLSLNGDFGKAFAAMEVLSINRKADYGSDKARLIYAGYRLGKFTPLLSYAEYSQNLNDPTSAPEGHRTISGVLRYDVNAASAVKVQLDAWKDKSGVGLTSQHGNSTLLSISYDRVF
jgi:hypothetical protein